MPALKLTASNIRTLPAVGGRRTEYRDDVQPALALRVFPSGARSWVVLYTSRAGKDRRFKIGQPDHMTLAEARVRAREVRAMVHLGEDPQAERNEQRRRPEALTVYQVVEQYVTAAKLKPDTRRQYLQLLNADVKGSAIERVEAAHLSRGQIRQWGERIARRAPVVANRAHDVVRAAFAWAVGEDLLPATPFVRKLRRPTQEDSTDRALALDELWAILAGLRKVGGQLAQAARLLLLAVTRESAVIESEAPEFRGLDGLAPLWTIPAHRRGLKRRASAKKPRPHLVPLSRQALKIVLARMEAIGPSGRYLFPQRRPRRLADERKRATAWWSSKFSARVRLEANLAHAGAVLAVDVSTDKGRALAEKALKDETVQPIPRWTWHNFRHTAITHMREHLGISKGLRKLLLGHVASSGADDLYDRAELLKRRRRALQRWADLVDAIEAGELPKRVIAGEGRFAGSGSGQAQ